ncbi:hypothetical protein HK098_005165 [Nowakowskiella sp. JEL0407]|nr:hypothetical protein HK098_005165 [Nowakowskiella sp. JEL0407]
MVVGILHVTVVAARNLKDKDLLGKSDPYVELYVDHHHKQRTQVAGGTLEPVWNESFTFAVNGEDKLHLKVLDKDILDSDSMGSCTVNLLDIASKGFFDGWVPLPAWFGLSSAGNGEVHLKMTFNKA